jgi:hypothetical protein
VCSNGVGMARTGVGAQLRSCRRGREWLRNGLRAVLKRARLVVGAIVRGRIKLAVGVEPPRSGAGVR